MSTIQIVLYRQKWYTEVTLFFASMSVWDRHSIQTIYSTYIKVAFLAVALLKTPFLLLAEKVAAREDRPRLWRLACRRHAKFLMHIAGVRLRIQPGFKELESSLPSAVFVANHPSIMDGFTMFTFLGPEIIPLTEPQGRLVFPVNLWFRRAGFVDVVRDDYDASQTTEGNDKSTAIQELVDYLKNDMHVLIFPEGHLERMHELHYIHTGAARIAIRAGKPVVPLGLVNVDHLTLDKSRSRPGSIYVRYREPIYPPKVSKTLSHHAAVKQFSHEIEEALISLLPARSVPMDLNDPEPQKIGVFMDIDNTLYRGYSQQDFVKFLMKEKRVSRILTLKVFFYLFLEKLKVITHEQLMRRALGFTRGWAEKDMEQLAESFFHTYVVPHLESHTLPIVKDHQKRGHTIVLITEIIEPLAKQFKKYFKAADARGTVLEKKHGVCTGGIVRLCWKEEKAKQLRTLAGKHGLDLKKSYAYGDSFSDVSMLQLVKHRVAVCPQSELMHMALLHNWNILN